MLVTMTETRMAAPDGVTVVQLTAGEKHDLPVELAERYLARGQAVEAKDAGAPAQNKDAGAAPENKTGADDDAPAENPDAPKRAPRSRKG